MHGQVTALISLILFALPLRADDWPQFRGPNSASVAEKMNLPNTWSKDKNVLWQTDVPGRGWSSPIVAKGRVFVTAVLNDNTPAPRPGLYIADLFGKTPPGEHRWQVFCIDLESGKILWQRDAKKGAPAGSIHIKNTYASETMVADVRDDPQAAERVYAYFGNVGVFCYDHQGKEIWSKEFAPHRTRMGWGTAASPVLHKGRLYIVNDNEEKSYLLALDAATGKEIWKVERAEKSNWATPFIWENPLRTEIITPGSGKVRSYDLEGKLLWEFAGMSIISIPTPSANADFLFVSSGYILDRLKPVYAIKPGASGDITLGAKETSNEFIAWCNKSAGPYHPSPLVYEGRIYVLLDKGFLTCHDAKTGKEIYGRQRIDPNRDKFTASPVAADGKIYVVSEDGDTFVIRAGANFEVLARNPLDDMTLATPALVDRSLLLRTASKLYRIGTPK
jgi:outer membrane protein assembly factor BamB